MSAMTRHRTRSWRLVNNPGNTWTITASYRKQLKNENCAKNPVLTSYALDENYLGRPALRFRTTLLTTNYGPIKVKTALVPLRRSSCLQKNIGFKMQQKTRLGRQLLKARIVGLFLSLYSSFVCNIVEINKVYMCKI